MWANLRNGGWAALWLVVLVILVLAAPILTYPLGRDQGEFAIIGSGILGGAVPYVDLWNPKPPAVFYTYAAAIQLFGHTVMALRAIDLLLFPLMAAALYAITRRLHSNAAGLWTVLLYGVFYFTETFWTLTQNDGIAAVVMTLAVWCAFVVLDDSALILPASFSHKKQEKQFAQQVPLPLEEEGFRVRAKITFIALCGALCALTLWFKYPFVFFVIALLIGYVWARGKFAIPEAAAFVGGGLVVGLGGMAHLASQGAFNAWLESARVTAGYTAQGYDFATFQAEITKYIGFRWQHWHILWVLSLWGIALVYTQFLKNHHEFPNRIVTERARWRIIVLWLMGTAVAMLVQAKGYDYHWLPMLPPLAIFAGSSVTISLRAVQQYTNRPLKRLVAVSFALVLITLLTVRTWGTALPYLTGRETPQEYYEHFVGGEFVASESHAVAAYLRQYIPPGETLYIWGFRPEVYYLTQTRPASRFIFQFPLAADWYPPEWQQQNVDTLWASLPPYVLVLQADYMPWVTGKDADSNTLLQEYTELNNWLIFNYERDTQIGNFHIWRRKPQTS